MTLRAKPLLLIAVMATLSACDNNFDPLSMLKSIGKEPAPTVAAPVPPPPPPPLVIKIGHVSTLTGQQAGTGLSSEYGARMAIDDANAAKIVINGNQNVQFELVTGDDRATPARAVEVAQALISRHVDAVVGQSGSEATAAAAKSYADANVIQLTAASAAALTAQGYQTMFRVGTSDKQQATALAKFAVENLKKTKLAVVSDGSAYGDGLASEFTKAAVAAGAEVILDRQITILDTQFNSTIAQIRTKKPELLFFAALDSQSAPFASQLKKAKAAVPLLLPDGSCTEDFIEIAGAASEGHFCARNGVPLEKLSGADTFVQRYQSRHTSDPTINAVFSYDAVMALADAVKRAGSGDREKIRAALANSDFRALSATIAFESNGDLKNGPVTVFESKTGKWELARLTSDALPLQPAPAADGQVAQAKPDTAKANSDAKLEQAAATVDAGTSPLKLQ
jgi:branched-chain amino acid transport system substrate-binding protein